jgi:TerC family integral membrane protein
MPGFFSWVESPTVWGWVGFHVFIFAMLALDLGVFQRKAHSVSMKEAGIWSAVWVSLALVFALGIGLFWSHWHPEDSGSHKALEFTTGYLVELSLSVDNLFVFMVIFRYFGVPASFQHRILFWGILGALVMRASFILTGAVILYYLSWMIYVFGAFLLLTGFKLLRSLEEDIDPEKNYLLRLGRRFLSIIQDDSPRFFVKRDGRWHSTSLFLVLLVVESTDVMFAVDSIPAIFGITRDPFIVYTSNIFAILGLRSMYFLLANFLGMFRYLGTGLGLVLMFVGVKMILEHAFEGTLQSWGIEKHVLILISLGMIALILVIAVVASLIAGPKEPLEKPPEAVSEAPVALSELPVEEAPPPRNSPTSDS